MDQPFPPVLSPAPTSHGLLRCGAIPKSQMSPTHRPPPNPSPRRTTKPIHPKPTTTHVTITPSRPFPPVLGPAPTSHGPLRCGVYEY